MTKSRFSRSHALVVAVGVVISLAGLALTPALAGVPSSATPYTLSVLTGRGIFEHSGNAGASSLYFPSGVARDTSGDTYIADWGNNVVEKVTPSSQMSVIFGNGKITPITPGPAIYSAARHPSSIAMDSTATTIYVSLAEQVVKISGGNVSLVAGNGRYGSPVPGNATSSPLCPGPLALAPSGNLYIASKCSSEVLVVSAGHLSVVAGNGTSGHITNGPATSSMLGNPEGIAIDPTSHDLYIADGANHQVARDSGGTLTVVAGSGQPGTSNSGNPLSWKFLEPEGIAVDAAHNVYFGDVGNYAIYKLSGGSITQTSVAHAVAIASNLSNGVFFADGWEHIDHAYGGSVVFIAGNPWYETATPGPATSSEHFSPGAVAADTHGNVYFADAGDHYIEKVSSTGQLSIVAGTGQAQQAVETPGPATNTAIGNVQGMTVDASGNIFAAEMGHSGGEILKITPTGTLSIVTSFSQNNNLQDPFGIALDPHGNLIVGDYDSNKILRITQAGQITVLAGTGTQGTPTPGPATSSKLNQPGGVAVDSAGNVYFVDLHENSWAGQILKITPAGTLSVVTNLPTTIAPSYSTELAVDGQGNLFIPDSATLQVYELPAGGYLEALAGNGLATLPTPGPALTSAMIPNSIALGPNGAIYVGNEYGDVMKLTVTPPLTAPTGSKLAMVR